VDAAVSKRHRLSPWVSLHLAVAFSAAGLLCGCNALTSVVGATSVKTAQQRRRSLWLAHRVAVPLQQCWSAISCVRQNPGIDWHMHWLLAGGTVCVTAN
jgi:hypothetical protein